MDDVFRELYQEIILDHNKNPRHFGVPDSYTHSAEGYNPLCGDKVHVFLTVRDGKIDSISFKGEGCAISKASASVMTTLLTGMPLAEAHALMKRFVEVVTEPSPCLRAASMACQARVAHLTRAGNSRTPTKANN